MREKNKRHDIEHFLKSTCDMELCLNRHENYINSDKEHGHFFKSTCDIGDPPVKGPLCRLSHLINNPVIRHLYAHVACYFFLKTSVAVSTLIKSHVAV